MAPFRTLAIATMLMIAGCSSLRPAGDAARFPVTERATLLNGTKSGSLYVGVFSIDGDDRWHGLKPKGFQLSPGEHSFVVQLNDYNYSGTNQFGSAHFRCTFESGKTYSVQVEISGDRFRAWIQDERTKQEHPCGR